MQSKANCGATTWSAAHLVKLNVNNDSVKGLVFYYWLKEVQRFLTNKKSDIKKTKSQELKKKNTRDKMLSLKEQQLTRFY